jgi:hypothetical protein
LNICVARPGRLNRYVRRYCLGKPEVGFPEATANSA